jgi:hypothetical protein
MMGELFIIYLLLNIFIFSLSFHVLKKIDNEVYESKENEVIEYINITYWIYSAVFLAFMIIIGCLYAGEIEKNKDIIVMSKSWYNIQIITYIMYSFIMILTVYKNLVYLKIIKKHYN